MKTTIDIPDTLYKKAKIRAVETGQTLKSLMVVSLEHELDPSFRAAESKPATWGSRKVLSEFGKLQAKGIFSPKPGDRDITDIISDDRDGR